MAKFHRVLLDLRLKGYISERAYKRRRRTQR